MGTIDALLAQLCIRFELDLLTTDADFRRLVGFYDELRQRVGCEMNLDLQRAAIATGAVSLQSRTGLGRIDAAEQALWILEGRDVKRIVVECVDDIEPFEGITDLPVVHLAEVTP